MYHSPKPTSSQPSSWRFGHTGCYIRAATHGSSLESIRELANCEEMGIATLAKTRLRTQLAKSLLTALSFITPKEIQPRGETTLAYHLDIRTCTMVHQPSMGTTRGSHVTSYFDMTELHAGSHEGCVMFLSITRVWYRACTRDRPWIYRFSRPPHAEFSHPRYSVRPRPGGCLLARRPQEALHLSRLERVDTPPLVW